MASFFTLFTGAKIPSVGLGTWKSQPGEVAGAVKAAIKAGYRHLDCAAVYCNEQEVGAALAEVFSDPSYGVKREDLFITSKLWNTMQRKENVRSACEKTLKDLGVGYLDLYLIHWPLSLAYHPTELFPKTEDGKIALDEVPIQETWTAMESLVEAGLVKHIGVSNFNVRRLKEVLSFAKIQPAANQVEMHPYLPQEELIQYCEQNKIHMTAYSCLGTSDSKKPTDPSLLADATIGEIAKKHGKSPAQVLLRWGVQRGTSVIPKSVNAERIAQNLNIFDFALTAEDMETIAKVPRFRFLQPKDFWGVDVFDGQ